MDGGETGGELQDEVGAFIGEQSDSEAMYYYGFYGMIHSVGAVLIYIFMNGNRYVAFNKAWYVTQIEFFAPVGFVWLMTGFFDLPLLKGIMRDVCFLSVMGPFFYLWQDIVQYILNGESWHWDRLMYYVGLASYGFYTIVQMVFQLALLPQVFGYLNEGDYEDPAVVIY